MARNSFCTAYLTTTAVWLAACGPALGGAGPIGKPYLIKDINPTHGVSSSPSGHIVNNKFIFSADDGAHGRELWVSDGTTVGTYLLKDINAGPASSQIDAMTPQGTRMFFQASDGSNGVELWVTNGTSAGTYMVEDINPSGDSNPGDGNCLNCPMALWGGNKVAFGADDGTVGRELWISDGTAAGTYRARDVLSGPDGSDIVWIREASGMLFFGATHFDKGHELWISDGTTVLSATHLVRDINSGPASSSPGWVTPMGGLVYFSATDGLFNYELWRSDGTLGGTVKVQDIHPTDGAEPAELTRVGGTLFFSAYDALNDRELWKSNGAWCDRVKDINPADGSFPAGLNEEGGLLFFTAIDPHGREPWVSDGTPSGTYMLKDINPWGDSNSSGWPVRLNGLFYFQADDGVHGRELWVSDLTEEGTYMVVDLWPGPDSSAAGIAADGTVNGRAMLVATTEDGRELWAMDVFQPLIPAASNWGLVVLSLTLAAGATLVLARRQGSLRSARVGR